ncbi:MAG: fatty acid desaturase [Planctomycetota bacterium]
MASSSEHGAPRLIWSITSPIVHLGAMASCGWAWFAGWWILVVPLWGVIIWMNHVALTRLHEGAHGMLPPSRPLNERQGILIGTGALIPLSVYRYVHARHHAHLGGERDPEFWPYNLPAVPRAVRVLYAWLELIVGWLLTPLLYSVRTAISWRSVPRKQRARVVAEWLLMALVWSGVLWLVTARGWWAGFLVVFVVPAWGAGVFQTMRKFTEHLGMHGDSIMAMTRTVVYRGTAGRLASASQLHVDHHGTHHRHARIPYYELPDSTGRVYGGGERLFRSHAEAVRDMLPHLLDPKVGPQWERGSRRAV